jgi:hypothetical protein
LIFRVFLIDLLFGNKGVPNLLRENVNFEIKNEVVNGFTVAA